MKIIEDKDGCQASRCRQVPTSTADGYKFCWKHAQEYAAKTGTKAESTVDGGLPEEEIELLKKEREEGEEGLAEIRGFEIESAEDFAFVEEEIGLVKTQWSRLEERRTKATSKFERAMKEIKSGLAEIDSWFRPVQSTLKEIEKLWKTKLVKYKARQEEERQRLLEAARKKAEEQEHPQAFEASEEEKQKTAGAIRDDLVAAAEAIPESESVTFIDRWVFQVVDASLLPREFLCPDFTKIRDTAKTLKDKANIPGVRIWNEPIVRGKAKK